MGGTDANAVSGHDIHIPFQNDLCCRDLRESLFEISEAQTGIGFGEVAFNKRYREYLFLSSRVRNPGPIGKVYLIVFWRVFRVFFISCFRDSITFTSYLPSFSLNISFTILGLALPLVSRMTWPTKNPMSLVLPFL